MAIYIENSVIDSKTFGPTGVSSNPLTLDGSTSAKAAPSANWLRNKCGINTNGMYWLNPGGLGANQFYCDFTFDNQQVWVMIVANRLNTNGLSGLTYASATAAQINTTGTYNSSLGFNLWVGLPYWKHLGNTICQYVSTSNVSISGSHTKRARWKFNGFTSTYAFIHPRDITVNVGADNPGWYTYHAVNGYNLTTYDNDQDVYVANCSTSYNNQPWWYGGCWDGNYFAGSGYADGPYWAGSAGDYHNYGAAFLSFTDL